MSNEDFGSISNSKDFSFFINNDNPSDFTFFNENEKQTLLRELDEELEISADGIAIGERLGVFPFKKAYLEYKRHYYRLPYHRPRPHTLRLYLVAVLKL